MSIRKRSLAGLAFLILPIATVAQINLGDRVASALIPKHNHVECGAGPSQTYPCIRDVMIGGVKFDVVGYDAKTKLIKYISTSDVHFRTSDGLQVGDWIEVSEEQLILYPGWNTYGPKSKDGWHTIVGSSLSAEKVQFQDGIVISLPAPRTESSKVGKIQIRGFDKSD